MSWLFKGLIYCLSIISFSFASNEITGCGGFLKSPIGIDFSKVTVKLFTKHGTLKDSSDCAPTNGYYFIPLSDKGEYSLKIQPPSGWHFEPKEVPILFDGVNDPCSLALDINFSFKGFAVSGKVLSRGLDKGPEGVNVILKSEAGEEIGRVTTGKKGVFELAPVFPGKYTVTAHHDSFKFTSNSSPVIVKNNGFELPEGSLMVAGFDLSGQVFSNVEPVKGVHIYLYSENNGNGLPLGCNKPTASAPVKGAICTVITDSTGTFRFSSVPSGRYRLVPHYESFQVLPAAITVDVKTAHVQLNEKFLVKGFSVKGRVLSGAKGNGLPDVSVYLDNAKVAKTDQEGRFQLDKMEPATYSLTAKSDDFEFPVLRVKISPTLPDLEPLIPSKVRICGIVIPSEGTPAVTVQIRPTVPSSSPIYTQVDKTSGAFCEFLSPGKYSISVVNEASSSGLQFLPFEKEIIVVDKPITDLQFSQLKATLRGKVSNLAAGVSDKGLSVKLKLGSKLVQVATPAASDGSFSFTDLAPGTYTVEIVSSLQCFEPSSQNINVNAPDIEMKPFVHKGFIIRIRSSHSTSMLVQTLKKEKVISLSLSRGDNEACIPSLDEYNFRPVGCHGYEKDSFLWQAGDQIPIDLIAVSHDLTGVVVMEDKTPVHVEIRSAKGEITKLGPLTPTKGSVGSFVAEFTYRAKEGELLEFKATAPMTVFTPDSVELRAGTDCEKEAVRLTGERGEMVEGKIEPALEGAKVTLQSEQSSLLLVQTTGRDGRFKFGPLKSSVVYSLTAEKESYVVTGPDGSNTFHAHKLAQVRVTVKDEANQNMLSGVLLSMTGGEKYRKNSITEDSGEHIFHSLSPSEYFLRPMMKEYKFEPQSVIIQLKAGESKDISLTGRRVAFSAFGIVTSLNGEPEPNVPLQAVGQGSCSSMQEEGLTDAVGNFRIRGLFPHCYYALKLKPDVKASVYRLAPPSRIIKASEGDVYDIKFTAFHHIDQMDLSVHVTATYPEHLKTLTVKLCKEDRLDSPLHVVRLDSLAGGVKNWGPAAAQERFLRGGLLVPLPYIPKDDTSYVIIAETSLSSHSHTFTEPSFRFVADRPYLSAQLNFHNQVRAVEQDSPRHLVAGLFLAVVVLAYWQMKLGWPLVTLAMNWYKAQTDPTAAGADAALKKKGRARKT